MGLTHPILLLQFPKCNFAAWFFCVCVSLTMLWIGFPIHTRRFHGFSQPLADPFFPLVYLNLASSIVFTRGPDSSAVSRVSPEASAGSRDGDKEAVMSVG